MNGLIAATLCSIALVITLASAGSRRAIDLPRRVALSDTGHSTPIAVGRFGNLAQRWRQQSVERAGVSPAAAAEWCDALARSVRAGTALRTALTQIIPNDPALALRSYPVRQAIERGAPIEAAVSMLGAENARRSTSTLTLIASVLATAGSVGGPTASSLDRLAGTLRLRVADGQERAAHSAQARLSSHVLTVVPLGLLALLALTDADVRVVLQSGVGVALVAFGLSMNFAGWWWMRAIITGGR